MPHFVTPAVRVVAETKINVENIDEYFISLGIDDHKFDLSADLEYLPEFAGRLCYRSFAPGLNPNVTKIREGNKNYLANIIAQQHGSVLEHASATFLFSNVSRVFTHELVRHRVGVAVSQESMRYVRLDDLPIVALPDWTERYKEYLLSLCKSAEGWMKIFEKFHLEGVTNFEKKKYYTSQMRRLVPHCVGTSILWTTNIRTLRHVLALRTAKAAEEEIRFVFNIVGDICMMNWPHLFQDFTRNEEGEWVSALSKV